VVYSKQQGRKRRGGGEGSEHPGRAPPRPSLALNGGGVPWGG
jgi:hypothetical protein